MKILKKYKIKTKSDLIFARTDLKNFFKDKNFIFKEFFLLAVMELGTNILKYAITGEMWLIEWEDSFALAALDKGKGIKDIKWAKEKGTSTGGSLGLGLYQLSQSESFMLDIFSFQKDPKGTVVLLRPKKGSNKFYLIDNYLDLPYGGDFVFSKGKFLIVGDVSGHGKIANRTAQKIKEFFLNVTFSCVLIDDTLKELHEFLLHNNLRSVVLSVVEITKSSVSLCGVGNLNVFVKNSEGLKYLTFKEGVVGEAFSSSSKFTFKEYSQIFITSDGINQKLMYNILNKTDDFYLSVIAGIYFAGVDDDKTILGVKYGS